VALNKDAAILAVLDKLWSRLGQDAFVVADHWACDPYAVGIANPLDLGVLVYIAYDGQPDWYSYELELPAPTGAYTYNVAGRSDGVTFDELANVVESHLKRA
jgi:hypothetical protein